jgi:hypothetical protein
MNIYAGKNKLTSKKITLRQLILDSINLKDNDIEIYPGVFDDKSSSWITIEKETKIINDGARVDITIAFNPENDNEIVEIEVHLSEKLQGYDEDTMVKL